MLSPSYWEFSSMKLGRKEPFHIGTGADIRPQKRSCKITESKRHDGDSKDILEKNICDMVQRFTEE
jgi:hypothetical protein